MRLRPRRFTRREGWIAAGAAVVLLVVLAVILNHLQSPQPLRFRLDLADRGAGLRTVSVYYLDPDSLALVARNREVLAGAARRDVARDLVAYLSEPGEGARGTLPPGVELLHFFEDGNGEVVLDFNDAVTGVSGNGILEERLQLSALVRTVAQNMGGVDRIRLLIHGRPLDRWGEHLRPPEVLEVAAW